MPRVVRRSVVCRLSSLVRRRVVPGADRARGGGLLRRDHLPQAGASIRDGAGPGPAGGDVLARCFAAPARLVGMVMNPAERRHERLGIRVELPRVAGAGEGAYAILRPGATAVREP